MSSADTFTEVWLAKLLSDLGDTREQIVETLRKAEIKGVPGQPSDCPIARYIAHRMREYCEGCDPRVTVSFGRAYINSGPYSTDDIGVDLPEPISEFVVAFDRAAGYYDLYDV